jgi:hypothetical protein
MGIGPRDTQAVLYEQIGNMGVMTLHNGHYLLIVDANGNSLQIPKWAAIELGKWIGSNFPDNMLHQTTQGMNASCAAEQRGAVHPSQPVEGRTYRDHSSSGNN